MGFFTCEQFPILVSLGMSPIGGREIYERFDKGFFFFLIFYGRRKVAYSSFAGSLKVQMYGYRLVSLLDF